MLGVFVVLICIFYKIARIVDILEKQFPPTEDDD